MKFRTVKSMSEECSGGGYNYVFATDDCMGKKVALKEATYSYKILPKHSEVTVDIIQDCVESPYRVYVDSKHSNRWAYYKYIESTSPDKSHLSNLKVVAEQTSGEYSEVVTAFVVTNLKCEPTDGGLLYDATEVLRRARRSRI